MVSRGKGSRRTGAKAASAVKKLHPVTKVVAVTALLIGLAVGAFAVIRVSANDRFVLKGQSNYSVDIGSSYVYAEEGVEAVCFGRDVSGKLQVETELQKDAEGRYIIPTDTEGVYTIIYTVDAFKFGEKAPNGVVKRVRVFTVFDTEEDGHNGAK